MYRANSIGRLTIFYIGKIVFSPGAAGRGRKQGGRNGRVSGPIFREGVGEGIRRAKKKEPPHRVRRLRRFAGPVSRVLCPGRSPGLCHLSTTAVTRRLQQPTPRHRASNPITAGIHGLATRGTYGRGHRCPRGGLLPRLFTLTACGRPLSNKGAGRGSRRSFSVTLP